MAPFAYTISGRVRHHFACHTWFTIGTRASRNRARIAYRDLRRAGVNATQARMIVCDLLAAGQSTVSRDEITDKAIAVIGTHTPHIGTERREVPA